MPESTQPGRDPGSELDIVGVFRLLARDWCRLTELLKAKTDRGERISDAEDDELANHPIEYAFTWIEHRTGISHGDLLATALRINTSMGLEYWKSQRPGKPERPDLTWVPVRLRKLDADGGTQQLMAELRDRFPTKMDALLHASDNADQRAAPPGAPAQSTPTRSAEANVSAGNGERGGRAFRAENPPRPTQPTTLLTDDEKSIWDALEGKALTGKELGKKLGKNEAVIRAHIGKMRAGGYELKNRARRGYYRPDRPPPDLPTDA